MPKINSVEKGAVVYNVIDTNITRAYYNQGVLFLGHGFWGNDRHPMNKVCLICYGNDGSISETVLQDARGGNDRPLFLVSEYNGQLRISPNLCALMGLTYIIF